MDKSAISAVFLDMDGVLTDGGYWSDSTGKQLKRFDSKDSKGISAAKTRGIFVAVISDDPSAPDIGRARCSDMGIEYMQSGTSESKLQIVEATCKQLNISLDNCAFMGDDIGDEEAMRAVALPASVSDAHPIALSIAKEGFIARRPGGHGAVREFFDWLLD